jgi:hypothetical protein
MQQQEVSGGVGGCVTVQGVVQGDAVALGHLQQQQEQEE